MHDFNLKDLESHPAMRSRDDNGTGNWIIQEPGYPQSHLSV